MNRCIYIAVPSDKSALSGTWKIKVNTAPVVSDIRIPSSFVVKSWYTAPQSELDVP